MIHSIMKYIRFSFIVLLTLSFFSCAKTLTDEDEFTLSNNGKNLDIYIPKGVSLEKMTESINIYKVESMTISGHIGGQNLAFIRTLCGADDPDFLGGSNLKNLNMKNCWFSSDDVVYYNRNGLKLTIERGLPSYAFENCYTLNSITLPDSFTPYTINKGAFSECILLNQIIWGSHVRKIEEDAFYNCSSMAIKEALILPEGLKDIGDRAFKKTIPSEVDLPSSIESIGAEAFSPILKNVTIRAADPPVIADDSFIFHINSDRILYVPKKSLNLYKIEPYISIFDEIIPFD